MKSAHFPIKDKIFGYRLAQKETDFVLRAKYLADQMIREVLHLSTVLWVTERETYTRDTNGKSFINGDFTGEFDREIIILGSIQAEQNIEKIEILVRMMMNKTKAKRRQAPCWINLYLDKPYSQSLFKASVLENDNSVHLP